MKTTISSLTQFLSGLVLFALLINPKLNSQWFPVFNYGNVNYLSSIYMLNTAVGLACGFNVGGNYTSQVVKTVDSGFTWNVIWSTDSFSVQDMLFTSSNTGYLFGGYYSVQNRIFKTTNGGSNWFDISASNIPFFMWSGYFLNDDTGYASGFGGTIIKTTNGGLNWFTVNNEYFLGNLYATYFLNNQTGFTAGDSGKILKTTNSGINWTGVHYDSNISISDLIFVDNNTGYAVGSNGVVLKTINNGGNWTNVNNLFYYLSGLYFSNNNTGYFVGSSGSIFRTTDGGLSATPQISSTSSFLSSIYFTDSNHGFTCGDNSTILRTTNGGVIGFHDPSSNIPDKFYLHQNYPNPFNPSTVIEFDIPRNSFITLKIYNNIGEEVKTVVNGFLNAGVHKADFDASSLPSGVYYYRLMAGDFIETRKMILIK